MSTTLLSSISALLQRPLVQILLILVSGGLAYSNTLHVPFIFDDFSVIVENRKLATVSTFFNSINFLDFSYKSRWFVLATLAFNKSISSGMSDVTGFHVVNLLIHLATGLTVYYLAKTTLASFDEKQLHRYALVPLIASLCFVLHPVQTQAVTYIVQRITSLATLMYLATLLLYVKIFFNQTLSETSLRLRHYLLYLSAIISCLLAMSAKEISFTLPLAMALFDICFLNGSARKRIVRLLPFILCMLLMPFYLVGLDYGMDAINHGGGDADSIPLSRWSYFYTQCCVLITYLRLLILPVKQNLDYNYPMYNSLFQPQVAASLVLIIALLGCAIYFLKTSFKNSCQIPVLLRISGFAIIWFFITNSIESGVIPLIDMIFEHRLYLPSVWFFMAIAVLVAELYHRSMHARPYVVTTALVLILLCGYATYQRNHVWKDRLTLWTDVVQKSPDKVRALTNLGKLLVRTDTDVAIALLERAIKNKPAYYPAHNVLGFALALKGNSAQALQHYFVAIRLAPNYAKAWENAGLLYIEQGNYANALLFLQRAFEIDPDGFISRESLQKILQMRKQ